MRFFRPVFLFTACALAAGCTYRTEVRQGSEQVLHHLDDLHIGMPREEVQALLGGAAMPRLLRSNILLYTYQLRPSGFQDKVQRRTLELVFDDAQRLQEVRVLKDDFSAAAQ